MRIFIVVLILIFALFYFGGSLLLDSGIADSKGISRVPAAVQIEKSYSRLKKFLVIVDPYIADMQKFFSGR